MQSLQISFIMFHRSKKGWLGQTNLWPLLSQKMSQMQEIPIVYYPWYLTTCLRIQLFYRTWYFNAIQKIWTWQRISRMLCNHYTFPQIQLQMFAHWSKVAPDFAQQIKEKVLCLLQNVEVHLNDIGIFSKTREENHAITDKALSCLEANSFTVNPLKCIWAIQETNLLG